MGKQMHADDTLTGRVLAHYELPGLARRIDEGLLALGEKPEAPSLSALAMVDEFHVRGHAVTRELIGRMSVTSGSRVLDVGSGLGGPARQLAAATGAEVTGVDISAMYCDVARSLTERTGLGGRVSFVSGRVESIAGTVPTFDAAWTIHVGMNVGNKEAFYRAISRALKPGARFLVYDVLSGPGGEPRYPMPWARSSAESFLVTAEELKTHLTSAGFAVDEFRDDSAAAASFMSNAIARVGALQRNRRRLVCTSCLARCSARSPRTSWPVCNRVPSP
jgi:sarcosine/dimethylglycine N-methyltransferase